MKIGVFDSGLGGLTILQAIQRELPQYDYVYYGDTANLPYGDKREEEIRALTEAGVRRLFAEGCLLVVVACNTASAETLRVLQETLLTGPYMDRRVLGVIIPTLEVFIESDASHALLIGTTRTVTSEKYAIELMKRGHGDQVLRAFATPGLVPLIEADDHRAACDYFEREVLPQIGEADTLILGCTHYTVLTDWLRRRFPKLTVISQDEIIPEKLRAYLARHPEIEERLTREGTRFYVITGNENQYFNHMWG